MSRTSSLPVFTRGYFKRSARMNVPPCRLISRSSTSVCTCTLLASADVEDTAAAMGLALADATSAGVDFGVFSATAPVDAWGTAEPSPADGAEGVPLALAAGVAVGAGRGA